MSACLEDGGRMSPACLRLALKDVVLDYAEALGRSNKLVPRDAELEGVFGFDRALKRALALLPRECPTEIERVLKPIHDAHQRAAKATRFSRSHGPEKPVTRPWGPGRGVPITDFADSIEESREAVAQALVHHGILELRQHGRDQRRRVPTQAAEENGLAWWIEPEGKPPFAVLDPWRVRDVEWMLNFSGIRARAAALPEPRQRAEWLLRHHGYLPDEWIANAAGMSRKTAWKLRQMFGFRNDITQVSNEQSNT